MNTYFACTTEESVA